MACGQMRLVRCVSWGVAAGYGGNGLRPNAFGPVCVLGRGRWLHYERQASVGGWR